MVQSDRLPLHVYITSSPHRWLIGIQVMYVCDRKRSCANRLRLEMELKSDFRGETSISAPFRSPPGAWLEALTLSPDAFSLSLGDALHRHSIPLSRDVIHTVLRRLLASSLI